MLQNCTVKEIHDELISCVVIILNSSTLIIPQCNGGKETAPKHFY
jgi:hypothetical protein